MAAEASGKKVMLVSSDGTKFEVDEVVAMESQTIKHMIEDCCGSDKISLPNVTGKMLAKVIEYCQYCVDMQKPMDEEQKKATEEGLKAWEAENINGEQAMLYDIILAANYLDIKSLWDLTTKKVGSLIKGKTVEEIRQNLNIKNDLSPEEEEKIRKENQWAFK